MKRKKADLLVNLVKCFDCVLDELVFLLKLQMFALETNLMTIMCSLKYLQVKDISRTLEKSDNAKSSKKDEVFHFFTGKVQIEIILHYFYTILPFAQYFLFCL